MNQNYPKVKYSRGLRDLEDPTASSFDISPAFENNTIHNQKLWSKKYIGRNIPLVWKDKEPLLTIGPDCKSIVLPFLIGLGAYFLCMWIFLVLLGIIVIFFVAREQSFTVFALSIGITTWEAFIYLYTALKNPGILSADEHALQQDQQDPE